ncbi:hypothetical protein Hanom_Chr05g00415701 [Helianthus anomalus]
MCSKVVLIAETHLSLSALARSMSILLLTSSANLASWALPSASAMALILIML